MAPCVSLEPELMTMIVSMSVFARRGREMVGKPKPKESYDPFFSVNSIQKNHRFARRFQIAQVRLQRRQASQRFSYALRRRSLTPPPPALALQPLAGLQISCKYCVTSYIYIGLVLACIDADVRK